MGHAALYRRRITLPEQYGTRRIANFPSPDGPERPDAGAEGVVAASPSVEPLKGPSADQ